MLYVFRGLSGVANGGIASLSAMIVSDIVTLKERGKWQGMIGACVGLGNISGPFIAAAFVQKSTWRGFFWLVSPVSAACGMLCLVVLPTPKEQPRADMKLVLKRIDYGGIFFGSAGLILLLIPIAGGGDYFEWESPMVVAMLTIGGCCMITFVYIEHRVAILPMMPCKLWSPYYETHALCESLLMLDSVSFQIRPRFHHASPEFPLWRGGLLANILSPPLLPERTPPLSPHFGVLNAATHRLTNDLLNFIRTIHLALRSLRRSDLARVLPLDFRCRFDMHVQPRHTHLGYSRHTFCPRTRSRCRLPARTCCTASTLHKSPTRSRHLKPQLHTQSRRCSRSCNFCCCTAKFLAPSYAARVSLLGTFFI